MIRYIVDIDGTICTNTNGDYANAKPILHRIEHFNRLFEAGNQVHYWSARGGNSGIDWTEFTENQLKEWNVKFSTFRLGKPVYDVWVDDKSYNADSYFYTNENSTNRT